MSRALRSFVTHLALLSFLVSTGMGASAQDVNADIYGKWKITALIGGGIGSLTERQARRLIGKYVTISAERFEFNGHACLSPNYQRRQEDPSIFFDREWHTDVSDIPFPNPVTIIETKDCDDLYLIRKDHLMIAEDSGFFEAVRIGKAPVASKSSGK